MAGWLPMVAKVEWRALSRGRQRPVALVIGGERVPVQVIESWIEGPREAGGRLVRTFVVGDDRGRLMRIRDDGETARVNLKAAMQ